MITVAESSSACWSSDVSANPKRSGTRDVLARIKTITCGECLQPIRWWNRRIRLVDGERCAHLQCWKGHLFFKALVADQIRCVQLMADENSASARPASAENGTAYAC